MNNEPNSGFSVRVVFSFSNFVDDCGLTQKMVRDITIVFFCFVVRHVCVISLTLNHFEGNKTKQIRKHEKLSSIPLLSLSLNMDRNQYVLRLIASIDHPVQHLLIQIGNSDAAVVDEIVESINRNGTNKFVKEITVATAKFNPGSANGFNFGLKALSHHPSADYAFIVNSDIAFYPGVLSRISRQTERALERDNRFGIGFTDLCCGSEWSAVVFTRRLVDTIGYFDENFYPAYYEDDDYAIRVHHARMRAIKFNNTALLHGDIDGSKDYLSGVFKELYLSPTKQSPPIQAWRKIFEYGAKVSKTYIEKKWGISMDKKNKLDCKSIIGMNHNCHTGYQTPFNNPFFNLSHWELDSVTRNQILKVGGYI